jgi:hypothetical protein
MELYMAVAHVALRSLRSVEDGRPDDRPQRHPVAGHRVVAGWPSRCRGGAAWRAWPRSRTSEEPTA